MNKMKIVSDTRDPFLVEQIEETRKERDEARKTKDQYDEEINDIATYLGCYGSAKAIIPEIEKYKESHEALKDLRDRHKLRFLLLRGYQWLIRKTAW